MLNWNVPSTTSRRRANSFDWSVTLRNEGRIKTHARDWVAQSGEKYISVNYYRCRAHPIAGFPFTLSTSRRPPLALYTLFIERRRRPAKPYMYRIFTASLSLTPCRIWQRCRLTVNVLTYGNTIAFSISCSLTYVHRGVSAITDEVRGRSELFSYEKFTWKVIASNAPSMCEKGSSENPSR